MESPVTLQFLKGKALVVFGCGYLGGAVARLAKAGGAEVWGVTRNAERIAELKAAGIHAVEADLLDKRWRVRVPDRADFVLNSISASTQDADGYRRSYIDGNKAIATWAYQGHCAHFIYCSSTGVYAQGGGREVDETAPLHGGGDRAELLRLGEDAACRIKSDVLTVARLAGIYGPGRHHFLNTVAAGGPIPGEGEDYMNMIHRDDAASALIALFRGSEARAFNLSDNSPATRAEVATWIRARLGMPAPEFAGGESSRRGTPSRRIVSSRIRQRTGWSPVYPDYKAGFESLLGEVTKS
jgi:nucleoside-diphosphate-sugar epimerase